MTAADRKLPVFSNDEERDADLAISVAHDHDNEGARQVRQSIKDAAPKNASLLSEISSTEEAAQALPNIAHNLDVTNEELAAQNSEVTRAALHSGVYRLRYDQRRGKVVAKWFYTLTRKRKEFDQKVEDAQKALRETVQEQSRAEMRQKALQHDLAKIESEHAAVLERAERHGKAHSELDELYHSIFDGPTPGFPDEDELEARHNTKRSQYRRATKRLKGVRKASKEGTLMVKDLEKVEFELRSALEESKTLFFLSEYCSLFLKRAIHVMEHALEMARGMDNSQAEIENRQFNSVHATMLQTLKTAYRALQDAVKIGYLGREEVAQAAETALRELPKAKESIQTMLEILKCHDDKDTRTLLATSREYEDARQNLHGMRQNAFEVTAGFGASAPAYHECCDRADGFTNDSLEACELVVVPPFDETGMPPPPSYDRATDGATDQQQ